ncbi:MAG: hypothetical protein Q9226_007908 [Calogaya cf. arnoldii]
MATIALSLTVSSSIALRLVAYVFLRWIPGHHAPPLVFLFACLYVISFLTVYRSQRTKAAATAPSSSNGRLADTLAKETDKVIQKGLQKTGGSNDVTPVQDAKQWPGWALLWGFPHPRSRCWTLSTAGINAILCLCVLDLVYRAPLMYPSHEVSFARVGHVSDTSASLLIREPDQRQLPLFVSYRSIPDSGDSLADASWKAVSRTYWLSNETDYTLTITIDGLQPTSRYQFAASNNQSGHFTTAPSQGRVAPGTDKLTFLMSSCIKPRFPYNPLSHPLSMPGFRHLASRLPNLKASFMLFLGDFIYVDVPRRLGSDPETYRREYRQKTTGTATPQLPIPQQPTPGVSTTRL